MSTRTSKKNNRLIAENRRARHDYFIQERIEAGLVLLGTEVKSIRAGEQSLQEAYIAARGQELFLFNMHIRPYEQGNRFNHDPLRPRKLLLHRRQIDRLLADVSQKGMTLVPLRLFLDRGFVKVEIGVARGKKSYDKRQDLAEKSAKRQIEQSLKRQRRGDSL